MLREQYDQLGFHQLNAQVFASLCIAWIIEPTSKLDSLRVLKELGVDHLEKNQLYRCLEESNRAGLLKNNPSGMF